MQEMELLNTILRSNPGISPETAMEMYKSYLIQFYKATDEIRRNFATMGNENVQNNIIDVKSVEEDPFKGYTKGMLKVKPSEAIREDKVACCICGTEFSSLTAKHIATHNGLDKIHYLKLCGYTQDQLLTCKKLIEERRAKTLQTKPWEKTERWQNKNNKPKDVDTQNSNKAKSKPKPTPNSTTES